MNKKLSTLVAALLASGGVFYAVDATVLPANDGVAQTYVAALTETETEGQTTTVTACDFVVADGFKSAWKVKTVSGSNYLEVADAEGWFLCESGISKVEATAEALAAAKAVAVTTPDISTLKIDEATGKVTVVQNGGNAVLYSNETTKAAVADNAVVGLAISKTVNAIAANNMAWSEQAEVPGTVKAKADVAAQENQWTLESGDDSHSSDKYLALNGSYVKVDGDKNLSLVSEKPNDDASVVTVGGVNNSLQLGGKFLSCQGGTLSLEEAEDNTNGFYLVASITKETKVTVIETSGVSGASDVYVISMAQSSLNGGLASWTELAEDQAMVPASNTVTGTNVDGSFDASDKWTVEADGANLNLKAGELYLNNAGGTVSLTDAPSVFTMGGDGALMQNGEFLVNSGGTISVVAQVSGQEKLYLFTEDGEFVSGTPTTGSYIIAEMKSAEQAGVVVDVKITSTSVAEDAPGADVPGMKESGVDVSETGEITLAEDVEEVKAIPAPFTVKTSEGYLTATGWDDEAETGASWILEDYEGKGILKSLAAEKAGKKEIYLGIAEATTKAGAEYTLVADKAKAVSASLTTEGFSMNGVVYADNTLKTTGEALAVVKDGQLSSVSTGMVVTFETEDSKVATPYKITVAGPFSDGSYSYSFEECDKYGQPTGTKLELGGGKDFKGPEYEKSFTLQAANGEYLTITDGALTADSENAVPFTLFAHKAAVESKAYSVEQLLNDFGIRTSFGVTLEHKFKNEDKEDDTKAITKGNLFADAELVPVKYENKELKEITGDDDDADNISAFLLKSGDRYIVLETTEGSEWTSIDKDNLTDGGYRFTTLGEAAMLKVLDGKSIDEDSKRTFAPYFTFNYDNTANKNGEGKAVYSIQVKASETATSPIYNVSSFEVKSGEGKGVYLTASTSTEYMVAAELGSNNLVKAKSDHSPLNHRYVNIEFANHPSIKDSEGKVINGRVPHADADNKTADKSEFLFNKPEGQWAVQVVNSNDGELNKKGVADKKDATSFTFRNRESGATFAVKGLYWLGDDKYAVSYSNGDQFAAGSASRDTMIITGIDTELKFGKVQRDGYADLKAADVQDKQFNLLVASTEEDYYVGENHSAKHHFLGLSHSETAAVNWRIVPLTGAREYDKDGILKTASDSVYIFNHSQYFGAGDKLFSSNDTIAIVSYALQNTENGEYLTYEDPQTTSILSMICDPNFKSFKTTKEVKDAYRFILKEKADGLYNIVSVNGGDKEYTVKDGVLTYPANEDKFFPYYKLGDNKLYGATTLTKQGAVEVEGKYTQINSNDLFKVVEVAAPEYRKLDQGDTIRIFREENNFDTMYENGEFLNLGNTAQLTEMAPALYVDTAYVDRGTNNRYQYLLVVNPTRVDEEKCNHKPADHPMIHPDTTYGRFLVNLIDSAVYAYKNGAIHSNKYINDKEADETYVKLGFVWGYRTSDKLYLTEGQDFTKVKAEIDLSTRDFNIAKFAFRYVNPTDADDKSFKIQTAYIDYNVAKDAKKADWEVTNDGYLKTINGVVVVTKDYARGEEFNLDAEESTPTANEGIAAEGVSVVATNGAIIVKGAEGKNVVITNVLGQQIANTVVTSSEATIAAPAGIVVVAVEGEAAVKAIVK